MNEKATIHRYLAADLEGDGIPEGTLVACIDGDCDEDKKAICFSLPDLRDPVCNAYLADLGPVLATIEVAPRGIEPYGFALTDPVKAESLRRRYVTARARLLLHITGAAS